MKGREALRGGRERKGKGSGGWQWLGGEQRKGGGKG